MLSRFLALRGLTGGGAEPAVIEPLSVTANGTYNPPEGVDGYSPVTVSVARDDQTDIEEQFIRAIERKSANPVTELPAGTTVIGAYAFYNSDYIALSSLPASVGRINSRAFYGCSLLALSSLPAGLEFIGQEAFLGCKKLAITSIPASLKQIYPNAFSQCQGLEEITFEGKPTEIRNSAFTGCTNLLTINVPWAEGEVENAPWGATYATINYNYTGG